MPHLLFDAQKAFRFNILNLSARYFSRFSISYYKNFYNYYLFAFLILTLAFIVFTRFIALTVFVVFNFFIAFGVDTR